MAESRPRPGAVAALEPIVGVRLSTREQFALQRALGGRRQSLDDGERADYQARGATLTLEQATALAGALPRG